MFCQSVPVFGTLFFFAGCSELSICSLLDQRGIPFVFYSGYDDMHRSWPDAVRVPKPADGRLLVEAVAGVLQRSFEKANWKAFLSAFRRAARSEELELTPKMMHAIAEPLRRHRDALVQ